MVIRLSLFFFLFNIATLQAQSKVLNSDLELSQLTEKYKLSLVQQKRAEQLITERDLSLESLNQNEVFDEPQLLQKRSSIVAGFENSIVLLLRKDQKSISKSDIIQQRKQNRAIIEQMKKEGYSHDEILNYLNKKIKTVQHQ